MKKSLIALAALAAAGVASAQSSTTLFGIVDINYAYGKGEGANCAPGQTTPCNTKKSQLTSNGYNTSRIGFRGTEDLGGGVTAGFWLEAGLNPDNGQGTATNSNNQFSGTGAASNGRQGLVFNRRSTISLSGGFGEVRLGRDYTPQFWNLTTFDPFGTNGVGTTLTYDSITGGLINLPTAARASNSVGYFLPGNLGGFYGQVQYSFGENSDPTFNAAGQNIKKDGNGAGFRFGFATGPINVALAMSKTDYTSVPNVVGQDVKQNNFGGQFDFGVAKLMGQYSWDTAGDVDGKGYTLGGLVPVGAGEIKASYSEYKVKLGAEPKSKKLAIGYVHNLSKRTAVYTTYAHLTNDNGASQSLNGSTTTVNGNSNGFDLGIRHSF